MKNIKRFIVLFLAAALVFALCSCSSNGITGEYKTFAIGFEEYGYVATGSGDFYDGSVTLNSDGTGSIVINEDSKDIKSWTAADDGAVTVELSDSTVTGTVKDGVMRLDYDDLSVYYVKDGADTSSIHLLSPEELQ